MKKTKYIAELEKQNELLSSEKKEAESVIKEADIIIKRLKSENESIKREIERLKNRPIGFITSDNELKFTPFDKNINHLKDLSEVGEKGAKATEKLRTAHALILDNISNKFATQDDLLQTKIGFYIFAAIIIIIINEIIKYFL